MSNYDLDLINAERRRKGKPPITPAQARTAVSTGPGSGFDMTHFLIGYATGIPMPSGAGIVGAMLHPSSSTAAASPSSSSDDSFSGGGGSYSGEGASSSWDSSSSSSSSDSSSSSSSDSGSSSSGSSE